MNKKILLYFVIFSISLFAMEENTSDTQESIEPYFAEASHGRRQDAFAILPVEIEEYILNFLIEEEIKAENINPIDTLINILSNKNLANAQQVHKFWNLLLSNRIKKLIDLIPNKKKDIKKRFYAICKKIMESYKQSNYEITKKDVKQLHSLLRFDPDISKNLCSYSLREFCQLHYLKLVELILNHIKNLKIDKQFEILNSKNGSGFTAFIYSATRPELLMMMLNHIKGFDNDMQIKILNAKNVYGETALMMSANIKHKACSKEAVELILNYISAFDPAIQLEIINTKERKVPNSPYVLCGRSAADYANESKNSEAWWLLKNAAYKLYLKTTYDKNCMVS